MEKIKLEQYAPYLPYSVLTQYRLGDVIDNAQNPNEIRYKTFMPEIEQITKQIQYWSNLADLLDKHIEFHYYTNRLINHLV